MEKKRPVEQMLRLNEAAKLLGITDDVLRRMVHRGDSPDAVRIGPRIIAFRPSDVERWLAGRKIEPQRELSVA